MMFFQSVKKLLSIKKTQDVFVLVTFFLLAVYFFLPGFQGKLIWGQDTPKIVFPFSYLLDKSLKEGALRMWTPNIFFGFPLGSEQGQFGIFYLPNIIHAFLDLPQALATLSAFHMSLAGIFLYLFLRLKKVNILPSMISGIAYMFNGSIIAHAQYPSHLYAYAYLPLGFLLIELAKKRNNILYVPLAGFFLGLQTLTGHPNIPIMTALATIAYLSYTFFKSKKKLLLVYFLFSVFYLSAALPYISQLITLLPLTNRAGGVSFADATNSSFSPFDFITFLFPNFFFKDISSSWNFAEVWHRFNYWGQIETTCYAGILTIILAIFAFSKNTIRKNYFFFCLLAFSLILAFGRNTPFYKLVFNLPVFNGLRAPGKFLLLTDFSLAILAALGFQNIINKYNVRKKIIALLLGFLLLIISLNLLQIYILNNKQAFTNIIGKIYASDGFFHDTSQVPEFFLYSLKNHTALGIIFMAISSVFICIYLISRKRVIGLVFPLILITDIFLFSKNVNLWKGRVNLFNNNAKDIVEIKNKVDPKASRVYTFSNFWSDIMPDQLITHNIPDANGFTSLKLLRYEAWQQIAESNWQKGNGKLFEMGSIAYVYERRGNNGILTNINNPLPRAFVISNLKYAKDEQQAFDYIQADSFLPQKEALVESTSILPIQKSNFFLPQEIKIDEPEYLKLEVTSSTQALLVLNDTYYPGWKAFINGKETEIIKTNYLFRGVAVPNGKSIVEFIYKPLFLNYALIAYISSLILSGFILFKLVVKRKK